MCGTIFPSANGVHQAWWLQWLIQLPATNQYIHTGPLGGEWTHDSEDWNLKPNHLASVFAAWSTFLLKLNWLWCEFFCTGRRQRCLCTLRIRLTLRPPAKVRGWDAYQVQGTPASGVTPAPPAAISFLVSHYCVLCVEDTSEPSASELCSRTHVHSR